MHTDGTNRQINENEKTWGRMGPTEGKPLCNLGWIYNKIFAEYEINYIPFWRSKLDFVQMTGP